MTNTLVSDVEPDEWFDPEAPEVTGSDAAPAAVKDQTPIIITERSGQGIASDLVLPPDKVRLLNYAAELERNGGKTLPADKAFSARVWAQVSLPYKDPGTSLPVWSRKNGDVTLRVRPAILTDKSGADTVAYPFGIMPRHIMTWMASEAVRTHSRHLILGKSMNTFIEKLQIETGGNTRRRLRDQMERVFGSQLSVEGLTRGEAGQGYGESKRFIQVTDSTDLWFSDKGEIDTDHLWASKITLSQPFYDSIIEAPLPVDMKALKALGTKPFTFDIYVWVGYRLYSLQYPTRMAWADLQMQFGSQTKRLRDFRGQFADALGDIKILLPSLQYEIEQDYLLLYPGPTPIEQTSKRHTVKSNRTISGAAAPVDS